MDQGTAITGEQSIVSAMAVLAKGQQRRVEALRIAHQPADAGSETHIARAKVVLAYIEGTEDE